MSRKFFWAAQFGSSNPIHVKLDERPNINIEETIITTESGHKVQIPGKYNWQPIKTTFDFSTGLDLIRLGVAFETANFEINTPKLKNFWLDQKHSLTLKLYDGCGSILEEWVLNNVWPKTIKFSDLYLTASSIEVTWTYTDAKYNQVKVLHSL